MSQIAGALQRDAAEVTQDIVTAAARIDDQVRCMSQILVATVAGEGQATYSQ